MTTRLQGNGSLPTTITTDHGAGTAVRRPTPWWPRRRVSPTPSPRGSAGSAVMSGDRRRRRRGRGARSAPASEERDGGPAEPADAGPPTAGPPHPRDRPVTADAPPGWTRSAGCVRSAGRVLHAHRAAGGPGTRRRRARDGGGQPAAHRGGPSADPPRHPGTRQRTTARTGPVDRIRARPTPASRSRCAATTTPPHPRGTDMVTSIGIDVGGTKIAAGRVDEEGSIVARARVPRPRSHRTPSRRRSPS